MRLEELLDKQSSTPIKLNAVTLENIDSEGRAVIIPLGDIHYGSKYCDKEYLGEILEWIYKNKNAYVIGMGDLLETATRDSIGAGLFDQDEVVQKQLEDMYAYLKPVADEGRLLGLHIGNHEERVRIHSGLDLMKTLAKMLGTKYFGYGVMHKIRVGGENYTVYSTHGASGSSYKHTKIKACMDLARFADAEIYLMGHVHSLDHATSEHYSVDIRSRTMKKQERHFIITGSYLDHWGSYAMQKGYEILKKGSPKIKLHSRQHLVRVSI